MLKLPIDELISFNFNNVSSGARSSLGSVSLSTSVSGSLSLEELFDDSSYFYHAIGTGRKEEAPEVIDLHNQRGQVENYGGFGVE